MNSTKNLTRKILQYIYIFQLNIALRKEEKKGRFYFTRLHRLLNYSGSTNVESKITDYCTLVAVATGKHCGHGGSGSYLNPSV